MCVLKLVNDVCMLYRAGYHLQGICMAYPRTGARPAWVDANTDRNRMTNAPASSFAHLSWPSDADPACWDSTEPPAAGAPESAMIGSLIRTQRLARGLSLREIADRVGCAKSYLSAIETGRRPAPRGELLERLESALGFEPGVLVRAAHRAGLPEPLRREMRSLETDRREAARVARLLAGAIVDEEGKLTGALDKAYRSGALHQFVERFISQPGRSADPSGGAEPVDLPVEVPLINSVSAGYPREFTDLGYPARVADEYVRCPDLSDPDAFAARVVGDSMEPDYRAGDVVIFSPAKPLKSGQDCFARIEPDQETTFKRVYFEVGEGGGEVIRLQPVNSRYAPRVLPRERVAGLYAAARVLRTLP